jgi:hypothetical protein
MWMWMKNKPPHPGNMRPEGFFGKERNFSSVEEPKARLSPSSAGRMSEKALY